MSHTTYRLLLEPPAPALDAGAGGPILPVPAGVAALSVDAAGQATLRPDAGENDALLWLESVQRGARQELLAVVPPAVPAARRPRRGGRPLARVSLLQVGDVLSLADGTLLHLTAHRDVRVSAPPESVVGCDCPVCRVPIEAGSRVYQCGCGVALHCELPDETDGEPLQCTELAPECPECGQPVELAGGYEFLPEGWHDLAL